MKNILLPMSTIFFGIIIYVVFLHKPISKWYCKKQVDFKFYSYTKSFKKNGAPEEFEINDGVKKFLERMYNDCLKNAKTK